MGLRLASQTFHLLLASTVVRRIVVLSEYLGQAGAQRARTSPGISTQYTVHSSGGTNTLACWREMSIFENWSKEGWHRIVHDLYCIISTCIAAGKCLCCTALFKNLLLAGIGGASPVVLVVQAEPGRPGMRLFVVVGVRTTEAGVKPEICV